MADSAKCCSGDGARVETPDSASSVTVNASSLGDMAEIFKALGDSRRLAIFQAIQQEPNICACTLLGRFDMAQPTLSHHMRILCDSGLVTSFRQGKWAHYNISPEGTSALDAFAHQLKEGLTLQ